MKKLRAAAAAVLAAAMLPSYSNAKDITVTVNGRELVTDVKPKITDNRTMVPMRAIFEALGAEVSWDDNTKTAVGTKDGINVSITIGDNHIYKNGAAAELDVPSMLVDGRTLVPVRAVSEAFGCKVDWQAGEERVVISSGGEMPTITLADIPDYSGSAYITINDNEPYFTSSDMTTVSFEYYSELDELGRCGPAYASLCTDTMPTEKRESISSVTPSGWINVKYDFVSGKYLYNRCHLIGFQLSGENANPRNLITGTRYMNVDGMLPFEDMTDAYIDQTGNHVMYRVTPMYEGNNLVADGVLMEAKSVEDDGAGLEFNVYCYNVQPGVTINYATGESWAN